MQKLMLLEIVMEDFDDVKFNSQFHAVIVQVFA